MKLSPMTNQRGVNAGAVKSGFDREDFYRANERSFDEQFGYKRGLSEGYDYCNALKNGSQHQYEQSLKLANRVEADRGQELGRNISRGEGYSAGY